MLLISAGHPVDLGTTVVNSANSLGTLCLTVRDYRRRTTTVHSPPTRPPPPERGRTRVRMGCDVSVRCCPSRVDPECLRIVAGVSVPWLTSPVLSSAHVHGRYKPRSNGGEGSKSDVRERGPCSQTIGDVVEGPFPGDLGSTESGAGGVG